MNQKNKKIKCLECKNDIEIKAEDLKPGHYFECPFCGITMEIKAIDKDGNLTITIVEQEK